MAAIGGKKIKLEAGTKEFSAYLTNVRWEKADADNDTVTFADAAAGGAKDVTMQGTGLQDDGGDADSFQEFVRSNKGDDVTVTYMPQGNETPSATQPHWTATVTVQDFDGVFLGGDANASASAKNTFDFSWPSTEPTKVTA